VSDKLPIVTVLIPTRPDLADIKAVTAARRLDYPADKLEILVARGKQPSVQRNTGMKAARGELVYFLDDDSIPELGNLRRAIAHFTDPKVKIVGGPNVCPPDAPELEQVFALVLASWLAFGPSRARYTSVGTVRETGEKELILCNLIARRDAVLELGGFNEALYPNEENALMDELQKGGGKLIYDPEFMVRRHPRPTLTAFSKMLLNYGRGRAEQFRVHPTFGSVLNFVPPLLCVYLLTLPVVWAMTFVPEAEWQRSAYHLPLLAYALAVLGQTFALISTASFVRALRAVPLVMLSHLLYGLGFWRGLFTRLKPPCQRPDVAVKLDVV
jgi:succinoglycan biosynthesis protein ExoA